MPSGISLASVLTPVLSGAASTIVGSLFGKGQSQPQGQAPAAPVVEPVTPMPTATGADATAAKQKSIVAQMQRQGRASTILTAGNASTSDAMG